MLAKHKKWKTKGYSTENESHGDEISWAVAKKTSATQPSRKGAIGTPAASCDDQHGLDRGWQYWLAATEQEQRSASLSECDTSEMLLWRWKSETRSYDHKVRALCTEAEPCFEQMQELNKCTHDQLSEAQTALSKMDDENGAKASSREDAQNEVEALRTQVSNDENFIEAEIPGQLRFAQTTKNTVWSRCVST